MENLFDYYLNELKDAKHPGYVLAKMYCEIFEIQFNKMYVSRFSSLVKIYGRDSVFKALINISLNRELNHDNISGLIAFICKKEREEKPIVNDLTNEILAREELIKAMKPLELRNPFDE